MNFSKQYLLLLTHRTGVNTMNWNKLTSDAQLEVIKEESARQPILIFKHSTTCSISAMALSRMERNWSDQIGVKPYYLDLLANRPISSKIEREFGIEHESPQVLLIRNGECVYDASHMAISFVGLQQAV